MNCCRAKYYLPAPLLQLEILKIYIWLYCSQYNVNKRIAKLINVKEYDLAEFTYNIYFLNIFKKEYAKTIENEK